MNCEWTKTRISWYLYEELDEAERAAVEEHLESCPGCAAEMERERKFLAQLDARPALEPAAALLAECRHDMMRSIYRAERLDREAALAGVSPWQLLRQVWSWLGDWRQPVSAACLLALGFFGGWQVRERARPGALPLDLSQASIANISLVSQDPGDGRVEVAFDELQRRTVSGQIQDPEIQKLLIHATRSYVNPGVRLDTIDILKQRAANRDIRDTLLHLVASDRNSGVRLKAMEGLKQYGPDPDVRRILVGVLTGDDNPGMRVQAIDILAGAQDRNLVGILQGVAEREPNNYVRMRCQEALRSMNASVETF